MMSFENTKLELEPLSPSSPSKVISSKRGSVETTEFERDDGDFRVQRAHTLRKSLTKR